MQQDHTEALANLATATKSNREVVSLLTKTISKLISQVTTLTNNFATVNNIIVSLKRNSNHGNGVGGETNNRSNDVTNESDCNIWSHSWRKFDPT